MNPELLAQILALLDQPESEVREKLDQIAAKNPLLADKIDAASGFLTACYRALAGNTVSGIAEIVSLLKAGSGPVAPDIGDTA